jgi:MEMO1 family protein
MIRHPVVAGQFYPGAPADLARTVRELTLGGASDLRARAIVVPHAGYIYSGGVAGKVYAAVEIPERAVIFCPNHTGAGAYAAVMTRGAWKMPWGDVPVDEELGSNLLAASALLAEDETAHRREHSLEVQLPFLRRFREAFRFVPISLSSLSLADCRALGESVAQVVAGMDPPPLLIASSDMTHYEPLAQAKKKDQMAISRILALDPEGLYRIVRSERISMCGVIPATVALFAASALGATEARLIRYATSGDVSGDYGQVVGYAGLAIL